MQSNKFSQMELSEEIRRAVDEIGFEEATDIQSAAIPLILQGRDVIGHSQTGTGKTAAFGLPAIELCKKGGRGTQVLVLCPTRELAVQACEEIRKFAKYREGIRAVPVYGGQPIERQLSALKAGAQIVVGTPGRVMDHMRRHTLRLNRLQMIVLDEADEMLSMGFRDDIETILEQTPEERQTILFSATMSPEILAITKRYQKAPELIRIAPQQMTVPSIRQYYYEVPVGRKTEVLSRLLDVYRPEISMVFCNTKRQVEQLASELQQRGYLADGLHGDMKQQQRDHVMDLFKKRKINVLVATDVAARGIDVDDVGAVFNYDLPQDVEYYVHRIGRTGRAGKEGAAFTLLSGRRQLWDLRSIMDYTKCKIELKAVPSLSQVTKTRTEQFLNRVFEQAKSGGLEQYEQAVEQLIQGGLEEHDALLALLKMGLEPAGQQNGSDDELFAAESRRGAAARRDRARSARRAPASREERRSGKEAGMVRLAINIGRENKVAPGHILGAIAGETGLPGKTFGRIEIGDKQSTIDVPKEQVAKVLDTMQNVKIMGKRTTVKPWSK